MQIEAPNDHILQKDIERVAEDLSFFSMIRNKTFLITGASGLLGSLLAKSLICLNRNYAFDVSVIALVRNYDKAVSVFGGLLENEKLQVVVGDILNIPNFDGPIDYVIHGASVTSSRFFVEHPVETIMTAINGTQNVLTLARSKNITGMVYLSSLEVYGALHSDEPVTESSGGYIDPLAVRSSYSESKRMVENLCCSYASQYGMPISIARLTQTFGAGVSYNDNRVFAQFARSVIENKNIVLHTQGNTIRNYCSTRDAVRALFYVLLKGTSGSAYNVANMDTGISIREMAELAASFGVSTEIVFELADGEEHGYNPTVKICLDTSKLNKLGWSAEVGMREMFQDLIDSMKKRRLQ